MSAKETSYGPGKPKTDAELRAERLKAALKSNMGRRKAQARARKASDGKEKED
ncbi:MAG: hypothetical protein AAF700_11990 [Pseudomonadota bacterium]